MRLSDMTPLGDVIKQHRADPAFRRAWDQGALARRVAIEIIRYRAEHRLTQQHLADLLGMQQSAVARLENGDTPPTLKSLAKITEATGLEFHLDITRKGGVELVTA